MKSLLGTHLLLVVGVLGCRSFSIEAVHVEPTYAQAAGWNDYVLRDLSLPTYAQAGTRCDGSEAGPPAVCVHAGEQRKVVLAGHADCQGVTGSDALGAFQWTCDDRDGHVTLYSTGLRPGVGLRDLIDGTAWRPNQVRVGFPSGEVVETAPDVWWPTPVVALPDNAATGSVALDQPGTIYVLASSRASGGYSIEADAIAVVTLAGATLRSVDHGANCDVSTGATGTNRCAITAAGRRFLWLEGSYDGGDVTVLLGNAKHSRLHELRASSAVLWGLSLRGASSTLVDDVFVANCGIYGVSIFGSHDNALFDLRAIGNGVSATTGSTGIVVDNSTRNVLANVLAVANQDSALLGYDAEGDNTYSHVTVANNTYAGVLVSGTVGHDTFVHVLAINNGIGLRLDGPAEVVADVAAASNDQGLCAQPSDASVQRELELGDNSVADCAVAATCSTTVSCSALLGGAFVGSGLAAAVALRGKLATDDEINQSDASGVASRSSIVDWIGFEHPMRGWGADGGSFPDATNRGPCVATCRIWDWRRRAGDATLVMRDAAGVPDTSPLVPDQPCPATVDGNAVVEDALGNVFLANALELAGDGEGDDDGLCESGEACVRSAYYGTHQDPGTQRTVGPCSFHDGRVVGVQMYGDGDGL